jgi:beta-mannosidase
MSIMEQPAVVLVVILAVAAADQTVISLNGDNWILSDSFGRVKGLQATVPGQVHTDLYKEGIIKDPYYGWNDWEERWVAYDNWQYSLTFDLTSDDVTGRTLYLRCGGLDTVANITVNGLLIGQANNFHRRWMFEIPNAVAGSNHIDIAFESAANYSVRMAGAYPYPVQGGGIYFNDSNRNFVRKPQSDFGWDWGPAFVPTGIWKNIDIISFQDAYVDYFIPKTYFNDTDKSYYASITTCVHVAHNSNPALTVDVKMECPYVKPIEGDFLADEAGDMCATLYSAPIIPDNIEPHLWWPAGVGDGTPNLITCNITINILDGEKQISTFSSSKKIGFRNIKIVQDPVGPSGADGLTFYFMMSTVLYGDVPIYAKGSNFIPMDAFVNRATPSFGRSILQSAVDGNQNMVRVWGGGLYQTSWFYELCDELGLMVWQEFMFADALYPRNKEFLENVHEEVVHTVRRLGNHPSIVLWSGNNENQDAGEQSNANLVDYSILYDQTVRATLWKEDSTRPYWPSSPSNGAVIDDPVRQLYIQRWGDSSNTNYGDIHSKTKNDSFSGSQLADVAIGNFSPCHTARDSQI